MRLEGKAAILTGGGSGIGKTTAMLFAREGAKVTVVDVDEKGGAMVVEEIIKGGGEARFVKADVSVAADAKRVVEEHMGSYGALDVLLNIAGVQPRGTVLTTTEDVWDRVMDVNVKGIYLLSRECIPLIAERKGAIVNMASAFGLHTPPNWAAYCVSKAAVIQLTKAMAVDHGPAGVRVNCICPGAIVTPTMLKNNTPEEIQERERTLPLRRLGTPADIANVVLFLASDESGYMTGAPVIVDGGALAT